MAIEKKFIENFRYSMLEKLITTCLCVLGVIIILALIGGVVYLILFLVPVILGAAGVGLIVITVFSALYFAYKFMKKRFVKTTDAGH